MHEIDEYNQSVAFGNQALDIEYLTKPMLDTLRWIAAHDTVQLATQDMRIQFLMLKGFIRQDQQLRYFITEKAKNALDLLCDDAETGERLH